MTPQQHDGQHRWYGQYGQHPGRASGERQCGRGLHLATAESTGPWAARRSGNGDGDFGARDPMAAIPTPVLRPRKRMIWEICEFIQTFILNSLGSGLCGVWCVVF